MTKKATLGLLLAHLLTGDASQAVSLASASLTLLGSSAGSAVFPGAGASGAATSPSHATLAAGNAFAGSASLPPFATAGPPTVLPPTFFWFKVGSNAAGSFSGVPLLGSAAFQGDLTVFGGLSDPLFTIPFVLGVSTTRSTFVLGTGGPPLQLVLKAARWTAGPLMTPYGTWAGTNMLGANGAGRPGAGRPGPSTPTSGGPRWEPTRSARTGAGRSPWCRPSSSRRRSAAHGRSSASSASPSPPSREARCCSRGAPSA